MLPFASVQRVRLRCPHCGTDDLRLANPQLSFASNGSISSTRTDIGFDAALSDLALVDPRLAGELTATGRATGTVGRRPALHTSHDPPPGPSSPSTHPPLPPGYNPATPRSCRGNTSSPPDVEGWS